VSYMKHSPTVEGAVITDDKLNQKMNWKYWLEFLKFFR
jgi:hypothetical protein